MDVNYLAQAIRTVDGNHDMSAGALAEALAPFIKIATETDAKNSARYRWLRDVASTEMAERVLDLWTQDETDAAIDAAMEAE